MRSFKKRIRKGRRNEMDGKTHRLDNKGTVGGMSEKEKAMIKRKREMFRKRRVVSSGG